MSGGVAAGASAGSAAAVAAAAVKAIKASGAIVQVDAADFVEILIRHEDPLVVVADRGLFRKTRYLTSYKGLIFFAKTSERLDLPADIEVIEAKKIWVPD